MEWSDITADCLGLKDGFKHYFCLFHETISFGRDNAASIYKSMENAALAITSNLYGKVIENQHQNAANAAG